MAKNLSVMRDPKDGRTRSLIETVPPTIAHGERYSDVGNARRLVRLFGDSIRWAPRVGWFWFDGTRWRRDVDGEMMRRAKAVTQAIIDGSRHFPSDARNEAVKFALRSEQAPRLTAMIELAKSESGIALPYSRFDADPWLVGVERGAVDLRTGTFLVPPANAYLSRRLGTEYNPHAQCPTWCAFLDRITAGDISLIEFLQHAIGYTLTGNAGEQVFFVLHGLGPTARAYSSGSSASLPANTVLMRRSRRFSIVHAGSRPTTSHAWRTCGSYAPPNSTRNARSPNRSSRQSPVARLSQHASCTANTSSLSRPSRFGSPAITSHEFRAMTTVSGAASAPHHCGSPFRLKSRTVTCWRNCGVNSQEYSTGPSSVPWRGNVTAWTRRE